jgi:hypothetical protein
VGIREVVHISTAYIPKGFFDFHPKRIELDHFLGVLVL